MLAQLIGSEFKNIVYNACDKRAKQLGVSVDRVQICFSLRTTLADFEHKIKYYQNNPGYESEMNTLVEKLRKDLKFFQLKQEDFPVQTYHMCEDYTRVEEVGFMRILDVKIDFKQYGLIVPPFIHDSLLRLCEEQGIEPENIYVFATPSFKDKRKAVSLYLYNQGTPVIPLTLDELLSGKTHEAEQPEEQEHQQQ